MTIRDERQREAIEVFLNSDRKSILNCCPRFGKIRVACEIMRNMKVGKVLILAPRRDIFKGWIDDFEKFGYVFLVDFVTFSGIKKIGNISSYGLIIIDEPHELSINQQVILAERLKGSDIPILGLTGTVTQKTRDELYDNLGLDICYKYAIDQGIEDGILTDYQMFIHQVPLSKILGTYGKKNHSEKRWFDISMKIRDQENQDPRTKHIMELRMISTIQKSLAKAAKTTSLINEYKSDRLLVFCGVTEVADKLGIPVYHSKVKEKDIFTSFCEGKGIDHLATVKMLQAGITINPIKRGIINYMSGNPEDSAQKICRFLGFEYDTPDKKAEIHIVTTNEPFELNRLKTGLLFFNQSKIVNLCA